MEQENCASEVDEDKEVWRFKRGQAKGQVLPQDWHGDFLDSLRNVNLSRDHIDLARQALYDHECVGLEAQLRGVYEAYGHGNPELPVIYKRELLKLLRPFAAELQKTSA